MSTTSAARAPAAVAVAALSGVGAAGSALMAISHAGVTVPLLAAMGPDGSQTMPVVAAGFVVATLLFITVAAGAWQQRPWAWPVGLTVNGLALVAATMPWRGPVSGAAVLTAAATLAILVAPPGRAAFLTGQRS